MRRLLLCVLSLGLILPSFVATPAYAGPSYRITFSGELAVGEWSTCPTWNVGDRCLFTRVIVGNSASHETNDFLDPDRRGEYLRSSGPSFVLQRFWFQVVRRDGELTALPTKESFGGIGVPGFPGSAGNPDVRIDTRLRTATATATDIRVHTTRYLPEESETWGYASADTRWVGSGRLDRIREGMIWRSERASMRESTTGWQRDAVATAVGRTPRGAFLGGFLLHAVQRESEGYRGGHLASPVTEAIATLTTGVPSAAPALTRSRLAAAYGEAFWTTCPQPRSGDRCRDVVVSYDSAGSVGEAPEAFAFVGIYDYVVAEVTDDYVDTRLIASVETYAPAASLHAPDDLTGATVRVADAEATLCDSDFSCTATTLSLRADWTGTGTAQRFTSHAVLWGDWGREWAHTKGHTRPATATATVSGLPAGLHMNGPVDGTLVGATISASRERHSAVLR